jgi:hypothetical protein
VTPAQRGKARCKRRRRKCPRAEVHTCVCVCVCVCVYTHSKTCAWASVFSTASSTAGVFSAASPSSSFSSSSPLSPASRASSPSLSLCISSPSTTCGDETAIRRLESCACCSLLLRILTRHCARVSACSAASSPPLPSCASRQQHGVASSACRPAGDQGGSQVGDEAIEAVGNGPQHAGRERARGLTSYWAAALGPPRLPSSPGREPALAPPHTAPRTLPVPQGPPPAQPAYHPVRAGLVHALCPRTSGAGERDL